MNIYEQIDDILSQDIIYEAIPNRSPVLKNIEEDISELKKDKNNRSIMKNIERNISKFSNIKNVQFKVVSGNNAYCITIYTDFFNKSLLDIFKKNEKKPKRLTHIVSEKETAKYIDRCYIFIGKDLLDMFTSQEIVAVLLHEIGHSFAHTTNIPNIIKVVNNFIRNIYTKLLTLYLFVPFTTLILFIITSFSRTLSFFEHVGEYNADKFAARYGYGDELSRVILKLNLDIQKEKPSTSWTKKILNKIIGLIKPGKTHPDDINRLKKLKESTLNEYKNRYKPIKKELDIIFAKI
ncbi:MAG: M48 family metalloprotease [bacterium]